MAIPGTICLCSTSVPATWEFDRDDRDSGVGKYGLRHLEISLIRIRPGRGTARFGLARRDPGEGNLTQLSIKFVGDSGTPIFRIDRNAPKCRAISLEIVFVISRMLPKSGEKKAGRRAPPRSTCSHEPYSSPPDYPGRCAHHFPCRPRSLVAGGERSGA